MKIRFRLVAFYLKQWFVPDVNFSVEDLVHISLHFASTEHGADENRPFTSVLASPRGKEAEVVESIIYDVSLSPCCSDRA